MPRATEVLQRIAIVGRSAAQNRADSVALGGEQAGVKLAFGR